MSLSLPFVERAGDPRDLHSFPTRRSSDLAHHRIWRSHAIAASGQPQGSPHIVVISGHGRTIICGLRSEEHTSELQSLTNLVCRLLLEKKKARRRRITLYRKRITAWPVNSS